MNQVSIIINGTRYNAVQVEEHQTGDLFCEQCDLFAECGDKNYLRFCAYHLDRDHVFKKSDKKFEK